MGWLQLFANPALLGGLALATAPLIIHLLNKRRFEVHEWAAMDFLFQASIMNRRRVRFEDLLILLLRILLIALLVFAVARPLMKGLGSWDEDRRLVVVDDSFSMSLNTPTGSVLDLASEAAVKQLRDATGRSVPVAVQLGSRPGQIGLPAEPLPDSPEAAAETDEARTGARDRWEMLDAVQHVQASDRPIELSQILERLVEEIEDEKEESRRSVAIISDFRRVDWIAEDSDKSLRRPLEVAFETLRDRDYSRRVGFFLIDVGRGAQSNVAITDVRIKEGHPIAGVPIKLLVEVTNFSPTARSYLEGDLEISPAGAGARSPKQSLRLPRFGRIEAGGSATVEVEHRFDAPGSYLVRATVDASADELPRDNESYCVVTVREALNTLIVDGDPGRERFAGESGYLLTALAPRGELRSGIQPRVHTEAISEESLVGADVVIVLNRSALSDPESAALRDFVSSGGGLIYFLGNRVRTETYRELAGNDPESSLFPGAFDQEISSRTRVTLKPTDLEHPAFGVFRGLEGAAIGESLFGRYVNFSASKEATVLARYDDAEGTPAIVEAPMGKGRIAVFNTSADRDWSDWPTHPSYVVLLQEWVRYLAPDRSREHNLETGGEIRWKARPGARYTVTLPGGERRSLPHDAEVAAMKERSFEDTARAGFYEVIEEPPPGVAPARDDPPVRRFFACRRPRLESDLEPLGEARLRALLDPLKVRYALGEKVEVDAFEREQEGELWRWFAIAAGLILLVELFTAWWFGRK